MIDAGAMRVDPFQAGGAALSYEGSVEIPTEENIRRLHLLGENVVVIANRDAQLVCQIRKA